MEYKWRIIYKENWLFCINYKIRAKTLEELKEKLDAELQDIEYSKLKPLKYKNKKVQIWDIIKDHNWTENYVVSWKHWGLFLKPVKEFVRFY